MGVDPGAAHTSSLLVCFWRLALSDEPPASLAAAGVFSSTGRGIADCPAGLLAKGMAPRPWPRPGVPRSVPGLTDMMAVLVGCDSLSAVDGVEIGFCALINSRNEFLVSRSV